jgi:hypothetical protein
MPKKFDEIDPWSNICGQGRSLPEWSDHLSLLNSRFLVLPPNSFIWQALSAWFNLMDGAYPFCVRIYCACCHDSQHKGLLCDTQQ